MWNKIWVISFCESLKKIVKCYFIFFTLISSGKCRKKKSDLFTCIYIEKCRNQQFIFFTTFSVKKVQSKMVKDVWKHGFLISNFTLFFTEHFSHILLWRSRCHFNQTRIIFFDWGNFFPLKSQNALICHTYILYHHSMPILEGIRPYLSGTCPECNFGPAVWQCTATMPMISDHSRCALFTSLQYQPSIYEKSATWSDMSGLF